MLICDTSGLIAYFDSSHAHHARASAAVAADGGPFVVPPYVVAELDYIVATRVGTHAELSVLDALASGAWELPPFGPDDLARGRGVVERYQDQGVGVADASIVVLADRYDTNRVLTLDRRHFGVLRTLAGKPFRLIPTQR